MNWEPAHADHSIDNVVASLRFAEVMDANVFDEVAVAARKAADKHGLSTRVDSVEPIELQGPPQPNVVIDLGSIVPRRRISFREIGTNGAVIRDFSIGMQTLVFTATVYRRWSGFFGVFTELYDAINAVTRIEEKVKAARLQYVDRFLSAVGGGNHFEVVDRQSPYITHAPVHQDAAFHVHSGWFDHQPGFVRKLTNVNIDAMDLVLPVVPPDARRSLTILTMGQFDALDGALKGPVGLLDDLHTYLQDIFKMTITSEAAECVGLKK